MRICTDFWRFNGGYRVRSFIFRGQAAERTDAGAPGRWKLAKGRQGHFAGQGLVDSPSSVWGKQSRTIDRRPGDCFEKHSHHSHPSPTLPVDSSLQVYRHPPYTVYPRHHQCLCSNCWESGRQVRKGLRCYPSIRWITGKIIPDQGTSAINSFVEITPIFDGSAKNI